MSSPVAMLARAPALAIRAPRGPLQPLRLWLLYCWMGGFLMGVGFA
ncbi:hypothetical protein [Pseudomarimonas salicorniae]|uniref:Uncharacterized protein n=1 Tax=Pseudomarimonas salicorniae TaxID=2933270 RepID=A0ABT0GLI7_9GAMM|nr:hypothetical protein [Lysobacter sp. CAU 1642]MCK7594912.1 hypothetical protein [Lysobacter sp. CAU 1642]